MPTISANTQTSGPKVSLDIPWETRQHLELLYEKIGNHWQAITLLKGQQNTTTVQTETIVSGGGGGGGAPTTLGIFTVNNQTGNTTYTTAQSDDGAMIVLNDASAIAVTLNTALTIPWGAFFTNLGAGTATLTPASGNINGSGSLALTTGSSAIVAFDGTNFWAIKVVPFTLNFADNETPSGTINSSNVTFTLAHSPSPAGSLELFYNGLAQQSGGTDFTLSGATITFASAPITGSSLLAWYRY